MEQHTCEICWDPIHQSELYLTNCKPVSHKFHIDCIKLNYQTFKNKECPMCRKPLNLNFNNIYPQCKYVLKQGKNKGMLCSKSGKYEGYCLTHKNKIDIINTSTSGGDEPAPIESLTQKCEATTKKGTNCKNKSKYEIQFNGKMIHVCGIHKNQLNIDVSLESQTIVVT